MLNTLFVHKEKLLIVENPFHHLLDFGAYEFLKNLINLSFQHRERLKC